ENIGNFGLIDGTAILDGFVIQTVNNAPAIYNINASPSIRNCTFENNSTTAIWSQLSGGVITNCVFISGLETPITVRSAAPQVLNCRFTTNYSAYFAGAINMDGGASPLVQDCLFQNNRGAEVGAISIADASSPIISRC